MSNASPASFCSQGQLNAAAILLGPRAASILVRPGLRTIDFTSLLKQFSKDTQLCGMPNMSTATCMSCQLSAACTHDEGKLLLAHAISANFCVTDILTMADTVRGL